jgi:cytochrome c oxidase subunit IV
MSTTTDHDLQHTEPAEHGHAEHGHGTTYYIKVAFILAVITALETSTYWWPESQPWSSAFMPVLISLMVIKFFMVVLLFMHLKDDAKVFSWLFYAGLFLAVLVYAAALLTFRFFG